WWKSPCPDLVRGRGGQPPGLLYNGLCAPSRRPRPPPHAPPPTPLPPGRWRATPRAAPARRCGQQPGDTRGRTVWTGPAAAGGGEIATGVLPALERRGHGPRGGGPLPRAHLAPQASATQSHVAGRARAGAIGGGTEASLP